MKIICTKDEFAELVRGCYSLGIMRACSDNCLFAPMCNGAGKDETCVMDVVEDICEIEVSNG